MSYDFEDLAAEELGLLDIVTPGQISDYRAGLLTSAATLNTEFQQSRGSIDPFVLESWDAWYNDLLEYADKAGFWGDLWGGAMNTAEEKARQLEDWRDIYKDATGKPPLGPAITAPGTGEEKLVEYTTLIKWIGIPVMAYFVWDIFRKR